MSAVHPLIDDRAHVFFDKNPARIIAGETLMRVEGILITRRQTSLFRFIRCASRQPKQGCNHSPNGNVIERVHQNKNQQKTKEVFPCSATRPSFAKIADKASPSPPASRNSTQKRVSPMSPSAARIAVQPASRALPAAAAATVRCMMQPAQVAASPAKSPSSPARIVLFTAAIASVSN